jgi:hypothetical protein
LAGFEVITVGPPAITEVKRLPAFPRVKGKIVERVETDPEAEAVVIAFQDHTVLSFDIDPHVLVYPELSDWKSGNLEGDQTLAACSK